MFIPAEYFLGKLEKFWAWVVVNSVNVLGVARLFLETVKVSGLWHSRWSACLVLHPMNT